MNKKYYPSDTWGGGACKACGNWTRPMYLDASGKFVVALCKNCHAKQTRK